MPKYKKRTLLQKKTKNQLVPPHLIYKQSGSILMCLFVSQIVKHPLGPSNCWHFAFKRAQTSETVLLKSSMAREKKRNVLVSADLVKLWALITSPNQQTHWLIHIRLLFKIYGGIFPVCLASWVDDSLIMLWFRNHMCTFSGRSPVFLDLGIVWFGFRK